MAKITIDTDHTYSQTEYAKKKNISPQLLQHRMKKLVVIHVRGARLIYDEAD